MEVISSYKNTKVKRLRKLYKSKWRRRWNCFVLEGSRLIDAALKAGAEFERNFVTPDFAKKEEQFVQRLESRSEVEYLESSLLKKIADTVTPQGIISVVKKENFSESEIFSEERPVLVLDRLRDPGNMGTIIRTAAAAGMGGVICLKGCVDIYNLKVLRATMGTIFQIPLITGKDVKDFIKQTAENTYKLIACDISGKKYHHQLQYDFPHMIIIGNEAHGIRTSLLDAVDYIVKIPLYGEVESLNASVAGGIIIYESAVKNNI